MNSILHRVHELYALLNHCFGSIILEALLQKSELSPRQLDNRLEVLLVRQLLTIKHEQLYITQRGYDF